VSVQTNQEPQHQPEAEQAGLHQQLRIVVMSFIYEQVRIEAVSYTHLDVYKRQEYVGFVGVQVNGSDLHQDITIR